MFYRPTFFSLSKKVNDLNSEKNWNSKKFWMKEKVLFSFLTIDIFQTPWSKSTIKSEFQDAPVNRLLILSPFHFFYN